MQREFDLDEIRSNYNEVRPAQRDYEWIGHLDLVLLSSPSSYYSHLESFQQHYQYQYVYLARVL